MNMNGLGGMAGMGGLDGGSVALFQPTNMHIARIFWYLVAAAAAVRGLRSLIDQLRNWIAKAKAKSTDPQYVPSRPTTFIAQAYDTVIAICRESSYPAVEPLTGKFTRYFSLPPLGQCLLMLAYWSVVLVMLWANVILKPTSDIYGYKWEIVGFRAGWVSVTQIPLIYALSCKVNVISMVTGISYERLNWMHRWVSRTVFLTIIVHWSYFFREWWLANFVTYELALMPMVIYGFAAWALIGWTVLTSYGLFRDLCYELWLIQHLASAGVLLWLLYVHLPSYAQYNVWLSIGFVAFDRIARGSWSIVRNINFRGELALTSLLGFHLDVEALPHKYLRLSIKKPKFKWRAGQHVFISLPGCGFLESHPFTIASDTKSEDLTLIIKAHSGFTARLHRKTTAQGSTKQRAFISGPWGTPPLSHIERADSLIFIASSTGASYTVPLLEHALRHAQFARTIHFCWIIRHREQLDWFRNRLETAPALLGNRKMESLSFTVFVTGSATLDMHDSHFEEVKETDGVMDTLSTAACTESTDSIEMKPMTDESSEKPVLAPIIPIPIPMPSLSSSSSSLSTSSSSSSDASVRKSKGPRLQKGRPESWDSMIRPTVEAALGETLIVACGGRQMMRQIRTYTAKLSDERAVHKGTGAQGIGLFTETYGW